MSHELASFYSHTGLPSVDPELMIRMLLVGYCYGIPSERRLCQKVHLNLAYRWFCRLGLEGTVPEHSSFSKNRPSAYFLYSMGVYPSSLGAYESTLNGSVDDDAVEITHALLSDRLVEQCLGNGCKASGARRNEHPVGRGRRACCHESRSRAQ
jgi:hypothetical protein